MEAASNGSINKLLSSIYYNTKNSASFSSAKNLFETAKIKLPNLSLEYVKKWLSEQITYTLHKPVKRNFQRNRIIVSRIDQQWEADLVDMREFSLKNNGNNYILTVIDCFSKYAFVMPIKTKTGKNIRNAFEALFRIRSPEYLRTDKGKEFINEDLQKLLIEKKINYFTTKDDLIKCAIVERFNRTLKSRMFKYFTSKGTRRYIDVLQDFVKAYNDSYHRSIKMKPKDVTKANTNIVLFNLYKVHDIRDLDKPAETKLKPGDKVRIQYKHKPFDKGYYPNWTDEVFTIDKTDKGDQKIVFRIKDYDGNQMEQRFYPEELQKITENLYRIQKVIKRRTRKGIKEVYVKWLNYPEKYNSWIPEKDLKDIYDE